MKIARLLTLVVSLFPAVHTFAQQTEAKTYQNQPVGVNMLQAGYMLQTTNTTVDNAISFPNKNVNVNVHAFYLRYVTFFKLGRLGGGVQAVLPFANIDANILGVNAKKSGLGDAMIAFGTNIIGIKPPLGVAEFSKHAKEPSLAWAMMITIPTGRYSNTALLRS